MLKGLPSSGLIGMMKISQDEKLNIVKAMVND